MRFVKIHPTTLILLIFAILFKFLPMLIAVYIVALVHELAHILVAQRLGVLVRQVEIYPFGVTMLLENECIKNPHKEIAVALVGPISNVLIALVCFALPPSDILTFFINANLAMAIVNLLPALPLDGGRMLRGILTNMYGFIKAHNFMIFLSKIVAFFVSLAGVAIFFYAGFNFSLILIGIFLFCSTVTESKVGKLIIMREILYNDNKLESVMPAKAYVASEEEPARSFLRKFSYNNYTNVFVVDGKKKHKRILTEGEILDGIREKGVRVRLKDLTKRE